MNAISPRLYVDLIGKPFAESARGPESFDCLGLVLEVARRIGKTLPEYVSSEEELHRQLGSGGEALGGLQRIEAAEPGAVVLLRGVPAHLGIMIDRWWMLHSAAGLGCVRERISSPLIAGRIAGFYRLEVQP